MTTSMDSVPHHVLECWLAQDALQLAELAYRLVDQLLRSRSLEPAYIALSGGTTPKRLYERMIQDPADAWIWKQAHWFVSDERNVTLDHPDSNFGLADRMLFQPASISKDQLHPVPIDIEAPDRAAEQYESLLEYHLPRRISGRPSFDLIFLGLGDDAHTASLFPGTAAVAERQRNVVANFVPKLNTQRITFTAPLINSAECVVFLVSGSSKTPALENIWHGPRDPNLYPAQLINGAHRIVWMVDRAALGQLDPPSHASVIQH